MRPFKKIHMIKCLDQPNRKPKYLHGVLKVNHEKLSYKVTLQITQVLAGVFRKYRTKERVGEKSKTGPAEKIAAGSIFPNFDWAIIGPAIIDPANFF